MLISNLNLSLNQVILEPIDNTDNLLNLLVLYLKFKWLSGWTRSNYLKAWIEYFPFVSFGYQIKNVQNKWSAIRGAKFQSNFFIRETCSSSRFFWDNYRTKCRSVESKACVSCQCKVFSKSADLNIFNQQNTNDSKCQMILSNE